MPDVLVLQTNGSYRPVAVDYPLPVQGISGGTPVKVQSPGAANMATTQVTLVAATSTSILAARTARRFARIRVDDNAAAGVYVTEQTPASTSNAFYIPPGYSEDVPYTGAIYAYSTGTPLIYIRDIYDS